MGTDLDTAAAKRFSLQIHRIHGLAGLSWGNMGQLFGVSTRSVHYWASGYRASPWRYAFADAVYEVVAGLAGTPPQRRRALLAYPADGSPSLFEQLMATRRIQEAMTVSDDD